MKCHYVDDKRHGDVIQFYTPGVIKEKTSFKNGIEASSIKYFQNGQIKRNAVFENKNPISRQDFYEDGQLKNEVIFNKDKDNTTLIVKSYYENGDKMRDSRYISPNRPVNYKFLRGYSYDKNGNTIPEILFMRTASFPGGTEMLKKYLRTNIIYPPSARKEKIQGRVRVSYTMIEKEISPSQEL